MPLIELVPVGDVPSEVLHALPEPLRERFPGRDVRVGARIEPPADTYAAGRQQWHAERIVAALPTSDAERVLGVVDLDLYVEDLNFVFGIARGDRAAISLARLRDPRRFLERAVKEAVHELGHAYSLGHCRRTACVMWFSNTLAETDRKSGEFCSAHARELESALTR